MSEFFIFLIGVYQKYISPLAGRHCRFYPSCSAYAKTALAEKGFAKGLMLSMQRILRCHPFHQGGFDFVK